MGDIIFIPKFKDTGKESETLTTMNALNNLIEELANAPANKCNISQAERLAAEVMEYAGYGALIGATPIVTYQKQIKESITSKNTLKNNFFTVIEHILNTSVSLFVLIMIGSLILFGLMIYYDSASVEVIAGAITTIVASLVTLVLSILKLPKIIAEYLFNKNEDKMMNNIIQNIQQYELESVRLEISRLEKGLQPKSTINNDTTVQGSPNDTGNVNWPDDRITERIDSPPTESIENSTILETISSPNESSEEQTDPNIFKEVLS